MWKSAEKIHQEAGLNGLQHLVIFPNSRGASVFSAQYAGLVKGEPAILPVAVSLDSWIFSLANLEPVGSEEAIVYLFEQFRKFRNPDEQLVNFQSLGKILLEDFELVVRAGRKPEEVFGHLHAWASAGATFADFLGEEELLVLKTFASFFEGNLSQGRERFLSLWKSIPTILEGFEQSLIAAGRCTSAMAYREVLFALRSGMQKLPYKQVWFVGFGNLSETEVQIMELVHESGKGRWIWDFPDVPSGPCAGEIQRLASRLQRRAAGSFGTGLFSQISKVPTRSTEVKADSLPLLIQWISRQQAVENWGAETAIIALDPVVYPLLDALQEEGRERFQFSLGFPLAYTAEVRWLERVLRAKQIDLQLDPLHWQDPILPDSLRLGPPPSSAIHAAEASTFIFQLIDWIESGLRPDGSSALVWVHILKSLKELIRLLSPIQEVEWSLELFRNFLGSIYNQFPLRLNRKQPAHAIQVIGLYETKVLNFSRIIVLPANEGSFPSSGDSNSFLPESIRKVFRMASRTDRQEDEMYQLGRLFYQAEEAWFLCLTNQESKRSRVLSQLEFSGLGLTKVQVAVSGHHIVPTGFSIEKDTVFSQVWNTYKAESDQPIVFSPSSLHELLRCEMAFYFNRFKKIQAPDLPSELEMSALDFGNWIHETIQHLYELNCKPGEKISAHTYKEMAAQWRQICEPVWNRQTNKESRRELGHYKIEQRIGNEMVRRFFGCMANSLPHAWLKNEYAYQPVRLESEDGSWLFGGRVDILIETDDEIRILDLKTGGAKKPSELRAVSSRNPGFSEKKLLLNKDIFQMVMYERLAILEQSLKGKRVRAGLIHLANPATEWVAPLAPIHGDQEALNAYFASFDAWIFGHLQLFGNLNVTVKQTDQQLLCAYCDFKAICQR